MTSRRSNYVLCSVTISFGNAVIAMQSIAMREHCSYAQHKINLAVIFFFSPVSAIAVSQLSLMPYEAKITILSRPTIRREIGILTGITRNKKIPIKHRNA